MTSIAEAIMKNDTLREMVFELYVEKIGKQCGSLCQRKDSLSPFRQIPVEKLAKFEWKSLIDNLSSKAPLLMKVFTAIVSHSDHRNREKTGSAHHPRICMATAVLLKERNREMCGLQSVISTLLYSSHVDKQVCTYNVHVHDCTCTGVFIHVGLFTVEPNWGVSELHRDSQLNG